MSVFYGWKISTLSMCGNFMLQGAALYSMNAFMEPLCEEHGWTRMGINFSLGIASFMGQAAMPIAAAIAQKISLRLLMTTGALAGGAATCAMGFSSNICFFTFLMIILWIASQFCGGVVANALMSNWFIQYRGIAFGLANSGTSFSGMVLPFFCLLLIDHFNLQTAYLTVGIGCCLLAPISWILVRRTPYMLHMYPDGKKKNSLQPGPPPVQPSLNFLVHTPAVWYIGISFGLAGMCSTGILSQIKPRFADLGIDGYTSMLLTSTGFLCGTLSKYVWGWICDKFSPIFAARCLMLFCFLSLMLMWLPKNIWTLALFALSFATSAGGIWVILPAVVSHYFGGACFLGVYKFIALFILLRSLGFPIMGFSYEYFHSYFASDIIFAITFLIAFILTLLINPVKVYNK